MLKLLKHASTGGHLAIRTPLRIAQCIAVWVVHEHAHCGHQWAYRSVCWVGQGSTGRSFRGIHMFEYLYVIVFLRDESHSNTLLFAFTGEDLRHYSMYTLFILMLFHFWTKRDTY